MVGGIHARLDDMLASQNKSTHWTIAFQRLDAIPLWPMTEVRQKTVFNVRSYFNALLE